MTNKNGNKTWGNTIATIGLTVVLVGGVITMTSAWNNIQQSIDGMKKEFIDSRQDLKIYIDHKSADRWAKTNDKLFMEEYSRQNNLVMIPHTKIVNPE